MTWGCIDRASVGEHQVVCRSGLIGRSGASVIYSADSSAPSTYSWHYGCAMAHLVRSLIPSDGGAAPILIIFVRGTTEAIRLPSLTDTQDGDLVDAVLAG
jgi:hypothetical protein